MAQIEQRPGRRNIKIEGDRVMVEDHRVGNQKRIQSIVVKKLSPVTFEIKIKPDIIWKRHIDQMYKEETSTDKLIEPEVKPD